MFYSCQKYITSHDEDSSGKPNLRDILQNNWPVLFQNVDVMKDKERLGAVPGLRRFKRIKRRDNQIQQVILDWN